MISSCERAIPLLPQDAVVIATQNKLGQGTQSVAFGGYVTLHTDQTPIAIALKISRGGERALEGDDNTDATFTELGFLSLLTREADAQQRIPHTLHAFGQISSAQIVGWEKQPDVPVAVVELLQGEKLSSMLHNGVVLPTQQAFSIMRELLLALAEIQGLGHATPSSEDQRPAIVHGDIKPSNIYVLIGDDQQIKLKLNDFGIARFEAQKIKGGTLGYQPPEQVSFGDYPATDAKKVMDTFAATIVLYEMLTGHQLLTHYDNSPLRLVMNMAQNNHLPVMRQQLETRGINTRVIEFILRGVTSPPANNGAHDIRYQDAIQMQQAFDEIVPDSTYTRRVIKRV